MGAGKSRDGFAVAVEGEAGGQFVGDQLVVGWPLKGQEGGKEAADFKGPGVGDGRPPKGARRRRRVDATRRVEDGTDGRG